MINFSELFLKATGHNPYPYQQRLAKISFVKSLGLRVPTSAGKTASIITAWLWQRHYHPNQRIREVIPRRLVYCLPMRVLVEQTELEARKILKNLELHKKIDLYMLMGGEVSRDWAIFPEKDTILIGTQDMLLSRALNRGYAASRSRWPMEFGLLNNDSLWVFDEIQLMSTGLATSIQMDAFRNNSSSLGIYGSCPSIWMSATFEKEWLRVVDQPNLPEKIELVELDVQDKKNEKLEKRLKARKKLEKIDVKTSIDPNKIAAHV